MKYLILTYILFFGYNTFSQELEKIEKLENDTIKIVGDKRLYIIDDNISEIFFNNDPIEGYVSNKDGEDNYIFLPIIDNELLNKKITSETFDLKIVKKDKNEILLTINYTPKYIYQPGTDDEDTPIEPTQKIVNSPKVTKTKFKSGDNILNDAKFLIKDLEIGKNSHELQMLKQDVLKNYNIDYKLIKQQKFLAFYSEYLGGANNALPNQHSSNIAKTDVTNIASGMARFLAERAKAELNESFFFYMHSQMEKVPELQFYFPQSYTVLKEIKKQNGNLNLEQLKTYFEQDIHKLPKNFYLTTQQKNFPVGSHLYTINNYLKNDANGQWIDYGLQVVFENDGKINPKELLHGFVHSDARKKLEGKLTKETDKNLLNTIKLAELVSNSLLSPEANRYWVSQKDINELLSDEALFQTYIGLLLAKSNFDEYRIAFNGTDLKLIIEEKYTNDGSIKDLKNLKNLVKGLYNSYADVDKAVSEITENKNNFNPENLYRVYNVLNDNINVITTQINDNKILKSNITVDDFYFKNYINPAVDIAYNMSSKKYNVAIKGFINLLENSVNKEQLKFIKNLAENFNNIDSLKNASFTKSLVIKYLSDNDNIKQLNSITGIKLEKITNYNKAEFNSFYEFVNEINTKDINHYVAFLANVKNTDNLNKYIEKTKNINEINKFISSTTNITEINKILEKAENIDELNKFIKNTKNIDKLNKFIENTKNINELDKFIKNTEKNNELTKFIKDSNTKNIDELKKFITDSKAKNTDELNKFITDSKAKNIDELNKLITNSNAENIDEFKKFLKNSNAKNIDEFKKFITDSNAENIDEFKKFLKNSNAKNIDEFKKFITDSNAENINKLITDSYAKKIDELNKFIKDSNAENIDELNKLITNSNAENIDELNKLITNSNAENIYELKKYLTKNEKVNINIEPTKDFIKFIKSIDSNKINNLSKIIIDNNYRIESLIYIAQNYNLNDPKLFSKEVFISAYFNTINNTNFKHFLNEIKSKPEVRNHFHKHVKKYSKDYNNFMSKFATYGVLIANVSMAQNSDEVKDAISASVLPVGSSRMKRHADWSITLNAYVGGFAGRAYFKDYNGTAYENKSIATFGVTAPIGISFNKGRMPFFGSKSTMGLTLQVVDLGSLVNFYAQKGDGAALPRDTKIELGDIIAPGGFLSYSIGDTPFTLMGGVQYVPNLSRMETIPTNAEFKPLTWRFHVGIAIDIPLFNLKVWN